MLNRAITIVLFIVAAGCTEHSATTNEPVLTGDSCAVYTDATTCDQDAACQWLATGCACPENDPTCTCPPGACASKLNGGSGSGSGSSGAACACPNGEVCYEQLGGPAQQSGTSPQIACTLPAPGSGDPCLLIEGEGHCSDSDTVSGLCLCDNGVR